MKKISTVQVFRNEIFKEQKLTIGLDLGDRWSFYCVLDEAGQILEVGAILPEPDIPGRERWGTSHGAESYPYVRSIGGVSLFDFRGFDPEGYSAEYPASSWEYFVPCHSSWDSAIWIEIDHEALATAFISGMELSARRKAEGSCRRIMPLIEAANMGPLPCRAFKRYFSVRQTPDSPLVSALKAARLKAQK